MLKSPIIYLVRKSSLTFQCVCSLVIKCSHKTSYYEVYQNIYLYFYSASLRCYLLLRYPAAENVKQCRRVVLLKLRYSRTVEDGIVERAQLCGAPWLCLWPSWLGWTDSPTHLVRLFCRRGSRLRVQRPRNCCQLARGFRLHCHSCAKPLLFGHETEEPKWQARESSMGQGTSDKYSAELTAGLWISSLLWCENQAAKSLVITVGIYVSTVSHNASTGLAEIPLWAHSAEDLPNQDSRD